MMIGTMTKVLSIPQSEFDSELFLSKIKKLNRLTKRAKTCCKVMKSKSSQEALGLVAA